MDLIGGNAIWPALDGVIRTYDPLEQSLECEILVLGGGITGAMLADRLIGAGHDVAVLDRRNFGWGSTSGSTALLMYEIDTHLGDLIGMYGRETAVTAYRSGVEAIDRTADLCRELGLEAFERRPSVYFASNEADGERLAAEFQVRREAGLRVEWIDGAEFGRTFDFEAAGAIRSLDAAELDPFRLTHALLSRAAAGGARLFARTEATECHETESGLLVRTDRGAEIRCRQVVVACGYESVKYLQARVPVSLHSSFAFATEPFHAPERDAAPGWPDRCFLWETARPYIYARRTPDGRALFGGEDVPFQNDIARDALLPRKIQRLEARWRELFPRLPLEVAFCWAGTFAETRDGLPYIGFPKEQPRAFFALCYGGNGITYSVLAAELLMAALREETHPCRDLFSFEREAAKPS